MGATDFLEPSVAAFVSYCLRFASRFLVVVGGIYLLLYVCPKKRWTVYRIQPWFPRRREVLHGILWTVSSTACTGLSTLAIWELVRIGHSAMYFQVADLGWRYFAFSTLLFILGFDTYMYWEHRCLHTRWLFEHVHAVHHRVANPTPFATFAQHPIETFMGNLYFVTFVALVPIHPMALAVANLYLAGFGIIAHSGYEFFPRGFTRSRALGWLNTSTHHNMHHSHQACNYGNWFNWWDRLMGTNHSAYHDTFDAITVRRLSAGSHLGLGSLDVADRPAIGGAA